MKVLVTGFGPFPGMPHNISGDIATTCAEIWNSRPDIQAQSLTLTTAWNTAPPAIIQHISWLQPDIIIHLGVSERAQHLTLETHAYNACCDTPDVTNQTAKRSLFNIEAPETVCTAVPVTKIVEQLEAAGHPVTISDDPGRYLCNAVYHTTLSMTGSQQPGTKALFIHIPTVLNENTVTRDILLAGLDIVLTVMAES